MPKKASSQRPLQALLVFNAISGRPEESPQQLIEILNQMQERAIAPQVFMVSQKDTDVDSAVRSAIRSGTRLIVVAGGDGTIDSVAGAMVGTDAALGIIPTGTRNNVSFNLGVPATVPDAVALLREGRRLKIDVGHMRSGKSSRWFLEGASLGLISDMYPAADDLQHGDLGQIGTLLSKFVASTPSKLRALLGSRERFDAEAFMVVIANMPYVGPRLQVAPDISCRDDKLDVFIFSDMTKLDLISYALRSAVGPTEDPRVKRHKVSSLNIASRPFMPALADGVMLESGPVTIRAHRRALTVITGESGPGLAGT